LNRNPECSKQNTSNKDPLQELTEKELQAVCKYVKGNETAWVPGRKHTKPGIWPHLQQNFRQNKKRHNIQKKNQNSEIFIPKAKIFFLLQQNLCFHTETHKYRANYKHIHIQLKFKSKAKYLE